MVLLANCVRLLIEAVSKARFNCVALRAQQVFFVYKVPLVLLNRLSLAAAQVLFIDEVSMVSATMWEALNTTM